MGQIAREGSDVVVITSDNPRSENPSTIIADILAGGVSADHIEVDRRAAIEWALGCATTGDSILIAGKGHEGYQIIGRERQPFSDQKVVEEWIRRCI
jgi:UDP-N-acetylmuramoyl-L-alanyl-D-glutamate--2,6-diaminopimelate ligase